MNQSAPRHILDRAFLADSGFILKPDFNRLVGHHAGKAARLRLRKFKSLLRRSVFLGMERPRLQPGQFQFTQPFGQRALVHRDGKHLRNLLSKIDATPPHNFVNLGVWSVHHQFAQLRHLHSPAA